MKRRAHLIALTLCAIVVATLVGASLYAGSPNVIVIVADDAGYADFGFSNGLSGTTSQIPTPNLDALATSGVTFSRAYVAQSCQPTRAALVTGGYQNRIGNEVVGNNLTSASGVFEGVPLETQTIWDRMKSVGYSTGAVGKWHLGQIADTPTQLGNRPQNQGVDEFYGIWHGSRSYTGGCCGGSQTQALREAIVHPNGSITDTIVESAHNGEYITNTFGDYGVNFIANHHDDANPFFLYQSFTAPHTPLHNSPDFNDPRLAGLSGIQKQYGSMMLTMDNEIGRILNRLDDPNGDGNMSDSVRDNTMIVFVNDNGGAHAGSSSPNGADNGHFRAGKGSPYEGGIRVPMIIAGAGVSPAAEGTVYNNAVHGVDVLPTAFAAGGGSFGPGDNKIDGVNLLPYINGTNTSVPHEVLVHRHRSQFAVIKGDWKLVHTGGNPSTNYQLFNVANDISETTNVAAANPDLVAELTRDLTEHEATFDKQRYAILGRTAEDTINLFDHFTFRPTEPGTGGSVAIINGATGNGDFNAGGSSPAGAQSYDMTPNWFNAQSSETINFTHDSQMGGSTDPGGVVRGGMPFRDRVQINDTGYTIAEEGEVFTVSYDFGAGGPAARWDNAEEMRTFLFTSSSGVDGSTVEGDITELADDVYSIDRAADGQWTQYEGTAFYTATAADVGKTVYFGMEFSDGDNSDGDLFPRIDIVRLTTSGSTSSNTSVTNWSSNGAWFEGGTSNVESMFSSDAFAGAVLEFPTTDGFSYVSNNDMVRQTGQEFMLNKMVLSGEFNGAANRTATIEGNEVLFTNDLDGVAPQIAVDASNAGSNGFQFELDLDIVMLNDLTISGDGDASVTINGQIRDFFEPRTLTKTGTSTVVLAGASSYGGDTVIMGGRLALVGNSTPGSTPRIEIQSGAFLDVSGRNSGGLTLGSGTVLSGSGTVDGDITMSGGLVSPGSGIGTLSINGDLTHNPGSITIMQLGAGSTEPYDQLSVNGTVTLGGGGLAIDTDDGFVEPTVRGQVDEYVLVVANQISGAFDVVTVGGEVVTEGTTYVGTGEGTQDGLFRIFSITSDEVTLTNYLALAGDANGDLVVDGLDFAVWSANKFTTGTDWTTGDFNGDGSTDGRDFLIWNQSKFTSVDRGASNLVPEPTSSVLLLFGMLGVLLSRRHRG